MTNSLLSAMFPPPIDWDLLYKKSGNVKCLKCREWVGPTYQKLKGKEWDGLCLNCGRDA